MVQVLLAGCSDGPNRRSRSDERIDPPVTAGDGQEAGTDGLTPCLQETLGKQSLGLLFKNIQFSS